MKRSLLYAAMALLFALTCETKAQDGPTLAASATSITFAWQQGANLPAAQSISVSASSGNPGYTAATPAMDTWLLATSAAGRLPTSLMVQVNPATLSPGVYVSTVTVTATGVASPLVITVTLTVTAPVIPPSAAPSAVSLSSPGTLTGTFTLSAGSFATAFTVTSDTAWLAVSVTGGALLSQQTRVVTVTANPAGLTPSDTAYTGGITVVMTSNGTTTTQTVSVSLTVNPLAPAVSSVWPAQIPMGSPDTVVQIRGANFYSATTVAASGSATPLITSLAGGNVLLATIPAALLAATGNIGLTVSNPAPGGPAAAVSVTVANISAISTITNGASYASGAISPGEIIAILGANIGPKAPATMTVSNGFAQPGVGGVTVTIDGQPAPIVYASSSQVNVQVPYTARPGTQAQGTARTVVLTFGTATPAQTTVDIVASAPGIFTLNSSGSGLAVVLNFDAATGAYSVNTATNPASIGSTVVFFLTGEGDYASAAYPVETGFIVPLTPPAGGSYPQLNPLPSVSIGGTAATDVAYAGPVPGSMLGLLQLNVVVPAGATTGTAAPLSVTIGNTQTQPNVTIAIQ